MLFLIFNPMSALHHAIKTFLVFALGVGFALTMLGLYHVAYGYQSHDGRIVCGCVVVSSACDETPSYCDQLDRGKP